MPRAPKATPKPPAPALDGAENASPERAAAVVEERAPPKRGAKARAPKKAPRAPRKPRAKAPPKVSASTAPSPSRGSGPKRKVEQLRAAVEEAKQLEPDERVRWLRDQALELYMDARGDGSHVAAEKALRAVLSLDQQLEAIAKSRAERDQSSAEGLSEEEYIERLVSRAGGMTDAHLEVFVQVWMERHPNVKLVVPGGAHAG